MNSLLVVLDVLTALFSPSTSVVPAAQAASACEGGSAPVWNETAQRTALVPFSNWDGDYMYEDAYYEDDKPASGEIAEPSESDWDPALHPEERYTYNPTWPLPVLEPLTTGQFTTVQIGNDSVGVLRFNLSHLHRTTFCVSLYESVDGELQSVNGDIYLMTSSQYDSYQEVYRMMHGGWWFWDSFGEDDDNILSDVPPEWRSFNPLGWETYRDVHQYERRSEATFSIAMDAPEVYDSLFGGSQWQDFYLIIDAWDNTNDDDAPAIDGVMVADITVVPTERTALLPPWTVPLTLFVALAAAVLAPVMLNKRYMNAGLDQHVASSSKAVPYLEQSSKTDSEQPALSIPSEPKRS